VIKSGNHLLTQVKDNQPACAEARAGIGGTQAARQRAKRDGGAQSPRDAAAEVFDAKAWFARTPWEPLIKTCCA